MQIAKLDSNLGIYTAIGTMSGTSCDGVDVALIRTDGKTKIELLGGLTLAYPLHFQNQIKQAIINDSNQAILEIEKEITIYHSQAIDMLIEQSHIVKENIDIIGFHGQTIKHLPEKGITQQIGNSTLLAHLTKIDVVGDFRKQDMVNGGEGAPLIPVFLEVLVTLFQGYHNMESLAFLNIGGVSNITYFSNGLLISFDIGPGNALIDDLVMKRLNLAYDSSGQIAAGGVVDNKLLNLYLKDDFFNKRPPKSLDRNHFNYIDLGDFATENAALTIVKLISIATQKAFDLLPNPPKHLVVYGGGRKNRAIMNNLSTTLGISICDIDDLGIDGDLIEAYAFGFLAVRSILNLPITFPSTTGVARISSGGVIFRA